MLLVLFAEVTLGLIFANDVALIRNKEVAYNTKDFVSYSFCIRIMFAFQSEATSNTILLEIQLMISDITYPSVKITSFGPRIPSS